MKTKAIRLYGVNDIRLEEFELPEITEDEVLIRVVSDSVCASTYKAIKQGPAHKRVPNDVAENPMYAQLALIVKNNGGLWCAEAEKYLLEHAPRL